jgi:two-component system, LytTR family, response regulator
MEPIRVVLVDDNEDALEIVSFYISNYPAFDIVGTCSNGEELIEEVMIQKPDLVLADINMPKKDGINAVRECLLLQPKLKFIFITGYDDHAITAFQMAAVDYIVKPVEKERLQQALEKAANIIRFEQGGIKQGTREKSFKNLVIKDPNCTRYIPVEDIYFIEKSGKKCFIHTAEEVLETSENLGKLYEKLLDEAFYSAHRSYIINLKKVTHIIPHHETFIAHFHDYDQQASISKLKINDVREKIASLQ